MDRPLSHKRPTNLRTFYFGAAYYPDHWPMEWWADDAALMADAGVNMVRMGEFAWDRYEPMPGRFDADWLVAAVDTLYAKGISSLLCTPTAAPPRWMTVQHPDMLRVDADGRSMHHGSRQHCSHMHEGFREYSRRITRVLAERFKDHPAVVGWQTDNEFHCHFSEDHSEPAQRGFIQWCRRRYNNDIAALNRAWGNAFWALTYNDFDQLLTPRINKPTHLNPAHRLDYCRFLADAVADFQHDQVAILRDTNPRWWLTHNGLFDHIDYRGRFTKDLDFIAFDVYPMFEPDPARRPGGQAFGLDRARSWSGNFFIPEQQSGAGGQPPYMLNSPAPGEMRQMIYRSIARGADGMLLFRWRSCPYGAEQYWQGVIDHDRVPRRRYKEFQQVGSELATLGNALLGTHVHIDAAVAGSDMDVNDGFAACDLGLPHPSKTAADAHETLFQRGYATGMVHPADDLDGLRLYVIPHFTLFDPAWFEPLQRFVERGGTLVIGAMSGTRDMHNNIVGNTAPGVLAPLAGVLVDDFARINTPDQRPALLHIKGQPDTPTQHWRETLLPQVDTEIVARWSGSWMNDQPAVTRHTHGRGRVYYVGTFLTREVCQALLPAIAIEAGLVPMIPPSDPPVEASLRVDADRRFLFLFNSHEDKPAHAKLPPGRHTDALTGKPAKPSVTIPALGVRIMRLE